MAWSRSRTAATPACGPASSSTCASWAATSTIFTAKWNTTARDAARRRVRAFPAECLRAKRMGTPPYCPYAFDGDHMSNRRASVSGRWPAWVGLGFALIAGVAMAAGPVEPDANTPAAAAASVPATELDRVVVPATRPADDALLVPAAVDVAGTDALRRALPLPGRSESLPPVPAAAARALQHQPRGLTLSTPGR